MINLRDFARVCGLGFTFGATLTASSAFACELEGQWASEVINASSEYSVDQWAAKQILGPCDISVYDDNSLAWSAKLPDQGLVTIEVGFPEATYPSGVIIHEAFDPGGY